jgi:hypothetical protein
MKRTARLASACRVSVDSRLAAAILIWVNDAIAHLRLLSRNKRTSTVMKSLRANPRSVNGMLILSGDAERHCPRQQTPDTILHLDRRAKSQSIVTGDADA